MYDIAIIGSGPGGYRAATLAALRGLRVAIVERADWGGCCLNRGCVPKKDWYHTARLVAASRDFSGRGIEGRLQAHMQAAWEHQERVVAQVQASYADYMSRLGIDAVHGDARLVGPHTLRVSRADGEQMIEARHVVLALGARPSVPDGLEPVPGRILTTDMLFDAPPPPGRRVAILGGGIVATEFAFIFAMLGKEVVWLTRSPPLRRTRFSRPARQALETMLGRYGIQARQDSRVRSVEVSERVRLTLDDGERVEVDWVCLGTGRTPNTTGVGLAELGIEVDGHGYICRNSHLQTALPHIYAIGDCASPQMTANHALADASVAVHNILRPGGRRQDGRAVPVVVYSAMELARVGLDEEQAEDEGHEPAVGFTAFETSPCALGQDQAEGFVRLLADLDTGTLLGGEIVGAEAGELIHLLSLAPDAHTALSWLAQGRYNHPTRAEELLNATETLARQWQMGARVWPGDG
jgi:dihydrolipoamide dehydrogenase